MSELKPSMSEAYRWGWDWAELGMLFHHWLEPHLGMNASEARQGFDDYHTSRTKGQDSE